MPPAPTVPERAVVVTSYGPLTTLRLNRPEAGNALDAQLSSDLIDAIDSAITDDGRGILIVGAGRRFSVGGDLNYFADHADPSAYLRYGAKRLGDAFGRLRGSSKPVVVGVHGTVAGGALGLVLAADVAIAGSSTLFSTGYSKVGLTPDCGVSWLLPRAVGPRRAADLLLTSRAISAELAAGWGLVTRVVDDELVHECATSLATELASSAPLAYTETKRLLEMSERRTLLESIADETETIAAAVATPESTGAVARFLGRQ